MRRVSHPPSRIRPGEAIGFTAWSQTGTFALKGMLKAAEGACAEGTGGKSGTGGIIRDGGAHGSGGRPGTGGSTGASEGNACGGPPATTCPAGLLCDLASSCGQSANATGACRITGPNAGCSTASYAPVCVCDGKTFDNDCSRHLVGMLRGAGRGYALPMVRLGGESASQGIAIGLAHLLELRVVVDERWILRSDRDAEVIRLDSAVATADGQLERLKLQIDGQHAGEGHDLIEAHRLMLRSPELAGEARRLVAEECLAAEWAVSRALVHIRSIFSQLDDVYFRERGGDFEVVGERLLRVLLGLPELRPGAAAPTGGIAVGVDISPLDPFHLHRAGIAGMASESGGLTSHASIVARALGMPYVVGVTQLSNNVRPGSTMIVDGTHGEVIVDPDPEVMRAYHARAVVLQQRTKQLESTRTLPAITSDGVRIHLAGNVESVTGIAAAVSAGAESIGLFRTEFLYLERADLPSEQEQYQDAVSALRSAGGLPITFRTLDLGGDKLPLAMKIPTGSNPALGIRSVRFLLQHPEILRRQLRALYRAASVGPLRFMFPLVSGVGELSQLRAICDEVRADLASDHIPHAPATELGVMIETPSAALTVDHLARHCDFLSVGTNDLLQYTFAADRENDAVAHLYQPVHPAVLRTLRALAKTAQAAKIPISICGDMAGNPFLTWILIGLGFRNLSMDAHAIPLVKAVLRGSSLVEAEALVAEALELENQVDVAELLESRVGLRFAVETEGFRPRRTID